MAKRTNLQRPRRQELPLHWRSPHLPDPPCKQAASVYRLRSTCSPSVHVKISQMLAKSDSERSLQKSVMDGYNYRLAVRVHSWAAQYPGVSLPRPPVESASLDAH